MSTNLGYCQRCDDGSYEWIIPKDSEMGRMQALYPQAMEWLRSSRGDTESRPQEDLIETALQLAGKGVQVDDGYTYSVPARDLVRYSEVIRALVVEIRRIRPIPEQEDLDG